ncbi:MAG TPA: hypothetical protein VGO68_10695 [Pyrinomonadaceae bacterium]|jgi:hypothetical protein|nr:hypothetical protein [Pyrinomonadaceae bacterium]
MFRHEPRRIGFLLLVALVGLFAFATAASAQKKVIVEARAFTPPNLSVLAEPRVVTACEGSGAAIVHLNARATSDYPISYRWTTNAGRISGDGANVTWDLSGLQPGYYKAYVDIDTGSGDEACQAFASTAVLVNRCAPPPPTCPNVAIECPDRVVVNEPLTFRSSVSGGSNVRQTYHWTVSAGRITEGQGTDTIRVDTTGLAGQSVTATLSMGGYNLDCTATCTVQFPVPVECRKFDEFPSIAYNDLKARLDNYAIELQNDPTATAYVIVYPGQRGRPGEVQKNTTRIVDYLVNSRGVNAARIVTLVGPPRDVLLVELWLCPQGAKPPAGDQ